MFTITALNYWFYRVSSQGTILEEKITMPLLYSSISRGTTVLARFANFAGNFAEVTEQVLAQISPDDSKMTYSHGSYLYHYMSEDRIIYLCISDDVSIEITRVVLWLNLIIHRVTQLSKQSH